MIKGKPSVKCACGKKSVIDKLVMYSKEEFDTYYELFRNEGNLLFELMSKKAVINDYNDELMNVYRCIKNEEEFSLMCKELNKHETYHSEKYYYEIRKLDRNKDKYNKMPSYKKASRLIYLNKTCFNGLYRVNSKNEFNVPFGKKTKVNTYNGGGESRHYIFILEFK